VTPVRQEWFGCACCPPNIARLLASLGGYVYSVSNRAAHVHLYAGGSAGMRLAGCDVTLTQRTDYPWDGRVSVTVALAPAAPGRGGASARFALMLRVPGWCRKFAVKVNGARLEPQVTRGYARVARRWRDGDVVSLSLAMPIERVAASPAVCADAGKVAIQRGPLVYCLEQCDHAAGVLSMALPDKARLAARFEPKLLGGCTVIEGEARAVSSAGWGQRLYRPAGDVRTRRVNLRAVPYCLWANRKPGAMTVWMPRA